MPRCINPVGGAPAVFVYSSEPIRGTTPLTVVIRPHPELRAEIVKYVKSDGKYGSLLMTFDGVEYPAGDANGADLFLNNSKPPRNPDIKDPTYLGSIAWSEVNAAGRGSFAFNLGEKFLELVKAGKLDPEKPFELTVRLKARKPTSDISNVKVPFEGFRVFVKKSKP
jgi:hypothetical protein